MYQDSIFQYYTAYQVQIETSPCKWENYCKPIEDKAEAKRLQAKAKRETGYKTRCFVFESCRERKD